ncbi:MAG: 16S rRNA (guanine(966)-N(2))-methyltransferase RsmD [Candidatus Acidiferrales bacterium]
MRVVAGKYRSRTLAAPRGMKLRPTSDRLRETLFDILGPSVEGSVFLDLFAGTGAVGIEALSRGARQVFFVESHRAGITLIRRNLASLGVASGAEVLAVDALRGCERLESRGVQADLVFLDPPYDAAAEYESILEFLGRSKLVAPAGRVIAEFARKRPPVETIAGLDRARIVEQGDAALGFYRLAARG